MKFDPLRTTELPLAAHGFISYRYNGRYGYIMIGARDDADALNEASRSTDEIKPENLEVWNGERYVHISDSTCQ
jgi:hypothetical protein